MKNDDLVTVVIPTYHRPDRISRAVLSVLMQTYQPIEIIVVDDNGKGTSFAESTKSALEQYICKHQLTYICNSKNSGGSYSRNVGLNMSSGKYISFLDDDDEIAPTKIEKQVQLLSKLDDSFSACYTLYHKIMKNGDVYRSNERVSGDVYKYALSKSIYIGSGSNLLVKTEVAKSIGGYDITFQRNQDLEFMTRVLKGHKLGFVDEDLFTIHYEIRETKRTYEYMDSIYQHYLDVFNSEIDNLCTQDKNNVYCILGLERARFALASRHYHEALNLLGTNHIGLNIQLEYLFYLMRRYLKKESYGFKL